jgi:hypothetical protein
VRPRVLRAVDRIATPWKNGLGVTREIAAHPPGAALDDFDWRVSMASVGAGGPFSNFPGIDRQLSVLEGRLSLSVDGQTPVELGPESLPLAFPGDVPVDAEVLAGPVIDLNVMTRRGRFTARVEPLTIGAGTTIATPAVTIILVRTEGIVLDMPGRIGLGHDDAILIDDSGPREVRLKPSRLSQTFVIHLSQSI